MTLSQELRQSIIQQVLSGKQYREISKEMGISIGSIANIVKKHRAENERSCSKHEQGQPKSSDVNISDVITSIDAGSSTFHGIELATLEHVDSNNESDQEINPPRNGQKGAPLSWFAPEMSTNIDFADTPYQEQSEISKTVNQQEDEEIDFSDSPAILNIEGEGFLLYSDPAVIWPKLLKQIKREKDQRRHEILVLERKKKILDIREDQINHDLEQLEGIRSEISAREAEAEPLLSLAHQFQSMGLDFDSLLPYIESLREQAARGIDFKTAAEFMIHEIKSYRQLGGIQKELESARNQLQMLKTATAQRERGLAMLAELENKGVSLAVIYELSRVLDLQKIAKELSARTDPWSSIIPTGQNGMNNGYNVGNNLGNGYMGTSQNSSTSTNQHPMKPEATEES